MKIHFLQFIIALGLSILLTLFIGGSLDTNDKGLYTIVSVMTNMLYLSFLIGVTFINRKIGFNIRALSFIFFILNIGLSVFFGSFKELPINRFLAIEFIPALIFISIIAALSKVKDV